MSSDMEAVNAFNAELSSLYDVKPPISKGKMTSITRAALKAVKLYKHVVQSVEKFIQKCKPEYKIPGLYVIDSIIRQSRHQFGAEKDVFATRFSRNLTNTFMHLYKCPDEDKAKIIRVLNLWQKNKIFMPDVIAPLFDLANPNHAIWETISSQQQASAESNNNSANKSSAADANQVHFKKELLDYDYDDDVDPTSDKDKGMMQQHSTGSSQGLAEKIPPNVLSGFDALGSLLANPEVLRQLQTLQEQMAAAAAQQSQLSQFSTPEQERQRKLAELNKQEAAFEQRLAQTVARLPFAVECEFDPTSKGQGDQAREEKPDNNVMIQQQLQAQQSAASMALLPPAFFQQLENNPNLATAPPPLPTIFDQQGNFGQFGQQLQQQQQQQQMHQQQELMSQGMFSHFNNFGGQQQPPPPQTQLQQQQPVAFDEKERDQRNRRRRSRSPVGIAAERRKSRSRSRSRSRRRSRSGSRGRVGRRRYTRSRSRERREEREREKERARKGFPTMRKEHLSVCSTTLWVGHLSRLVSQEEISDTFGAYGDIVSIDLIAPRGCAFVVMNRRQDALRALDRLKNVKLQGKAITLAWAPGKSVKGREWKDYWEVEHGVSYIPWTKLKGDTSIDDFEDGGCVDEDTLPPYLKDRPKPVPPPESAGVDMKGDVSQDGGKGLSGIMTPTTANAGISAPLLPTPSSVQVLMDGNPQQHQTPVSGGDTDARVELNAVAAAVHATGQPLGPTGPPGMVQPFVGLPPQAVGLMGMGQFGMMVPPPSMLGGPGGPGPGLQPFGPPPSLLGVMGGGPPGMLGPGGPMGTPTGPGAGLLGDMPMVHPVLQSSINSNVVDMASGSFGSDPEIKRMRSQDDDVTRPTGDVQKRKKSRFEDIPVDEKSSDGMSRKDERVPLHERLKNIAEYGMDGRQSLLGAPRGAGMGNSLMFNNGQATPIGADGGPGGGGGGGFIRPSLFASPIAGPVNPALPPGPPQAPPGAWGFDSGNDNPFLNPNNPNPFIGNPFMQQQQGPAGGNPFDLSSSFEDFNSPRGRGGWMGGRDAQQQQSPQKWGGRGGDRGGNWGRGDRRADDRFDDSWRSGGGGGGGGREGRGHRDSRSGDRSDHRDNRDYRGGDRGGGGRDWKERDGGRRGRFDRDGPPRRSRHDSGENVSANGGGNADSETTPRRNRSREDEKPKKDSGESKDKSESWEEDQKSGKENEWNMEGEGLNEDWDENVSREEKNNTEEDQSSSALLNEEQHEEESSSVLPPPPNDSEQRLEGPEDDDGGDPDAPSSNQREPEPSSEYQDDFYEAEEEEEEGTTNVNSSSNNNNNNHSNDHHIVEENNDWTNSDSVMNNDDNENDDDDEPEEASVQNCWNSSVNNYSDSANSNSVVQEANDERRQDDEDDDNYVGNGEESGEEAQDLCEDVRNYDEGNSHNVVNDHSPPPAAAVVKQCEPSTPLDSSCLLLSSTGTNNVQCNDESNNSHENELIETDGDAV